MTEKSKLQTLFKALADVKAKCEEEKDVEFPVKYIVQMDADERYGNTHETVDEGDQKTATEDHGVELIGFTELLAKGKDAEIMEKFKGKNEPKSEDIAYIMYTSGTTGHVIWEYTLSFAHSLSLSLFHCHFVSEIEPVFRNCRWLQIDCFSDI